MPQEIPGLEIAFPNPVLGVPNPLTIGEAVPKPALFFPAPKSL